MFERDGKTKMSAAQPKPVQALDTQTVFTMRKMMERVVLSGTGTKAHIIGYSTAGKTGTAQIFDFAHHAYTHNYNASFMGFAPVTNPQIVVVATVAGTSGLMGMAAQAAAPPFEAVAEEALRLRGIPRDLPAELELTKDKKERKAVETEENDLSIADLSDPPTPEDMRQALGEGGEDNAASFVAASNVSTPKAPNFLGKSVDDVVEEAAEQGIQIEAKGKGLARAQRPAPGEALLPGAPVRILFAR
jgi:cell division protein FtsI (penicillin-binding protein 3)